MSVGSIAIRDLAQQALTFKYAEGGRDPSTGFDCWGLVHWMLCQLGHTIPDYTDDKVCSVNGYSRFIEEYHKYGVEIDRKDAKPGDVLFFRRHGLAGHAGILLDKGKFIHCNKAGVQVSRLSDQYHARTLTAVVRIHDDNH